MGNDDRTARVTALLHEAAETHHVVYRITDGTDADWATWYADWLLRLSELPEVLRSSPARSQLTTALVELDRRYRAKHSDQRWEDFYAPELLREFGG